MSPDEEEAVFHPERQGAQAHHTHVNQNEEQTAKPILYATCSQVVQWGFLFCVFEVLLYQRLACHPHWLFACMITHAGQAQEAQLGMFSNQLSPTSLVSG